jgi:hypothetical protein
MAATACALKTSVTEQTSVTERDEVQLERSPTAPLHTHQRRAMTFYHASEVTFAPGDLIEPGHPANFADEPSGYVFFTDNLEAAEFWEEFLGGQSQAEKLGYWPTIHRYEVEQPNDYFRDDHYVNDELSGVWMTKEPLRVIRLLETIEA